MFESKALREERAGVIEELQKLAAEVQTAQRSMTAEETEKFDQLESRQSELQNQIETAERFAVADSLQVSSAETAERAAKAPSFAARSAGVTDHDHDQAFRAWALESVGASQYVTEAMRSSAHRCGVSTRSSQLDVSTRAQTVGTASEGGHTVNDGTIVGLDKRIRSYGGVRRVARSISTGTGEPISVPTFDDSTSEGQIVAENAVVPSTSVGFGRVSLGAYKYTSGNVYPVSIELLQDSQVDVRGLIAEALSDRISRVYNRHFTLGTGSGQPTGVVTAATAGIELAAADDIDYGELVDSYHSLDEADRGNAVWMMHDQTAAVLRKMVDNNGRPLWQVSLQVGQPDSVLGRPVVINNHMAPLDGTLSATPILFGDFGKYLIRDVAETRLITLNERYADQLAVGFLAYSRMDATCQGPYAVKAVTTPSA